jgi:hypothetical protein
MRYLLTVLIILTVATLLTACGHSETELGNQLGCHLAGNGCNSQGPVGAIGQTGAPGQNGLPGLVGPAGPQGLTGNSPVTVVPLCPGVSNYGAFVEVGLCINDSLYAVYSQNGGFMTLLAPGNYTSNAIGSACNLTVQANCAVSH